ncbi:MAG: polysaccharide biosynthesis protein [Salibacteraceae bacterium]|nr:polysaccharide biosynthesis protein [Salibacteraceae bacterium]MDP4764399.1 polysaccharide biosynthesis protein [Salibacteraceae bacterium]MDP4842858.1 polysaccharide biosynthesis protein [Salibacteraceae bacterium]
MITLNNISTPRWMIFLLDLLFSLLSILIAYNLRFNFNIPESEEIFAMQKILAVLLVRGISFFALRSFSGYVRYTSSKDVERLARIVLIGTIIYPILNLVWRGITKEAFLIPMSVVLIDFFILTFLLIGYRLLVKVIYFEYKSSDQKEENIIIFGAGEAGIITKRTFDRETGENYNVIAFIDENPKKIKRVIEGVPIEPFAKLASLVEKNKVDRVIISVQNLDPEKKAHIIKICLPLNAKVQTVPPVRKWINGELSANQIRNVRIEDLLGRAQIELNEKDIIKELKNKTILVTGAAGSIGSGLVYQLAKFAQGKLILLDQAESGLYELQGELNRMNIRVDFDVVVGSIRNYERLVKVFEIFKPDIVFHAAAYKHVPLMEENPTEAIRTNVNGTKNLVDLAMKYNVEKFVLISTDKAVNPTNVMGASKRLAEIYAQTANGRSKTKFITTRFGNVLGSNGSVIPVFRKQIEQGGPITVTHPEVTRFFMTIPEACRLVLEAGTMGKGGEIFIFDMGESVKIVELAKQMIKLSGLELGRDIQLVFTGLRPGEKLYEELLANKENTMPTHHPRILIGKVRIYDWEEVQSKIKELVNLYDFQDNRRAVKVMKELIPEFISQNSPFSEIDDEMGRKLD